MRHLHYTRRLFLVLAAALSLAGCIREEDIDLEGGSLPMILKGGLVPFDADTKAKDPLGFEDGATVFVRLENGSSVVLGTAVYSADSGTWTFTYNGSIAGWGSVDAKCYYIPSVKSDASYTVTLSPEQPVFEDRAATLTVGTSSVTLEAHLSPKTGRLSMGKGLGSGASRSIRFISGLSWYDSFDLTDYTFGSASGEYAFKATSTNYFHGFFTDPDEPTLELQSGSLIYSRTFAAGAVLQAGHSGFLTVPSFSSHEGWTIENPIDADQEDFTVNGVSFKMVTIPAGSFRMGIEGYDGDEVPVHNVTLDEYKIGETEVTQALWEAVMGSNPSEHTGDGNRPVESINYFDAQVFAYRLSQLTGMNFRLPTEAEWEYAARELGGDLKYSGSDVLDDVAWYFGNATEPQPVGTKNANALGLYDMSGNVWEMVSDWYDAYPAEDQTNPLGNSFGSVPLLRGGSYNEGSQCRTTDRQSDWSYTARDGNGNVGFRLACGGPVYEPEKVDLGLPSGVLWSSVNIGAARPSDIGYYISWGGKEPGASFYWTDYEYADGNDWINTNRYTYADGRTDGQWYTDGVFTGDGLTVLDPSDDTAAFLWGDQWRMPSVADFQELLDYCECSVETLNGIYGMRVTGRENGNSIFLPAAGCIVGDDYQNLGAYEWYPSTSLGDRSNYFTALYISRYGDLAFDRGRTRMEGYPVRPVWGTGTGGNYAMEVSPESVEFPLTGTGKNRSEILTFRNTGYLPLTVTVSSDNNAFTLSETSFTLAAQQSRQVTVVFAPSSEGSLSDIITVSAAELSDSWTLPVSGGGIQSDSQTYTVNGVSFQMIKVPAGTFRMGMEDGYFGDESPVHSVTLDAFQIGETEVTQGLWKAVMGGNPSSNPSGDNYPVECVSRYDAVAFIQKLNALTGGNFRLPTEAEWEYAARECSSDYLFSGSDNIEEVAWYLWNCNSTQPVATKLPNALGLYDMSGNVAEWCSGWYGDYSSDDQYNPRGWAYCVNGGANHRGGHFNDDEAYCRITRKGSSDYTPTNRAATTGFRLACGGPAYEPEKVDLGLASGVLWASFNIGACSPEEIGDYYAWGESATKGSFYWSNYRFTGGNSRWEYINRYTFADGQTDGSWYSGNTFVGDGLTVLDPSDDPVGALWGDGWRMPSAHDFQELLDCCSGAVETVNGITGMRIYGPNGNSIFLPCAGRFKDDSYDYTNEAAWYPTTSTGSYSQYFTSLYVNSDGRLYIDEGRENIEYVRERREGYPIRPVYGGESGNYAIEVTETLTFGNSPINASTTKTFTVQNTGYLPLTIDLSSDNGAFTLSETSFTLPARQNRKIDVIFTPTSATSYTGKVSVLPQEYAIPCTVSLSGRGFDVEATTYSYGGVSFNMIAVPGGSFDMGMDGERTVTVSNFAIGQTEVTQELWTAVMGSNPSSHTGEANLPVESVSWYDAKAFAARLSALTGYDFRLPTEAEWELAARGGYPASNETFSGSDGVDGVAWESENSGGCTHEVMTKAPNSLGLYDMSGNVWEWCEGFYGDDPADGSVNPRGLAYGSSANHRGGAYDSPLNNCRVTMRSHQEEGTSRREVIGFRLAMGGPVYTPEAIDLGLSDGVEWASFNIGACAPEEVGDYFAWGETIPKYDYSWDTYAYWNGSDNVTKYDTDGLDTLEEADDAASARWGSPWRMPTGSEIRTLCQECSWSWESVNGMPCYRATGPSGNSILIPLSGFKRDKAWSYFPGDRLAVYAGSSVIVGNNYYCSSIYAETGNGFCNESSFERYHGFQVRPVQGGIIHVESVSLNKPGLTLYVGESAQLTATLSPGIATNQSVTWSSSDRSVATVDQTGKVTAAGAGTATITVTTQDRNLTATCKVTVLYGNNGNPSGGGSEGIGGGEDD